MPHKNMDSGFTFIRFSRRICADCRVEQFVPFMELSCVSCLASTHTHTQHTHTHTSIDFRSRRKRKGDTRQMIYGTHTPCPTHTHAHFILPRRLRHIHSHINTYTHTHAQTHTHTHTHTHTTQTHTHTHAHTHTHHTHTHTAHTHTHNTHTHTPETWALLAYPCADNQETEVLAAGCRQTSRAHGALVVAAPQRCIVFAHPTRTNMLGIWTKCTWFCLCILWRVLRLRTNISFGATFCRASLSSY